ncbi:hypothetical protein CYLTODRAFT_495390 [Cylindrobasidium torrendii FP15055 ss-10]|uniref:Uncharacterized protein n=1 Tax=Cylindrobasidium torrendii FP15055 ss-10 TaxID=1314674 RepID=A0A0D7ASZ5_9AGAR|nr:hypothetical protein CYLTODRAFT_495390 [Cylindrobasidium torrendii FP15055 ss-10]
MFFTRIAAAFAIGSTLFAAAAPTPCARELEVEVEVEVEVSDILNDLLDVTTSVLPELSAVTDITEATVLPLVQKLTDALQTASSDLHGLRMPDTGAILASRDGQEEVAQLLNTVLSDVGNTLNPILGDLQKIPAVAALLKELNPVLHTVLATVETLLPGVLALVSGLLGPVVDILHGLGLGGVLGLLGL